MRRPLFAALVVALTSLTTPAWGQTAPSAPPLLPAAPGPIPRAVVDLRTSMAMLGQDTITASDLGLAVGQLGARGFGGQFGAHVYPLRTGGFSLGLGGDAVLALSQSQPLDSNKQPVGDAVRRRLTSIAFQVSGNFGHRHGWSYLTLGFGPTSFETYKATAVRDGLAPATLNFGGGARWFRWGRAAFTTDIRFYATKPALPTAATAGRARQKVVLLSAGLSFR